MFAICRGMQCTSYVKMAPGVSVEQLRQALITKYEGEYVAVYRRKGHKYPSRTLTYSSLGRHRCGVCYVTGLLGGWGL